MLTVKENVRETLKKDGHPDRFVNQYEYLGMTFTPSVGAAMPKYGGEPIVNAWGVTMSWPEGTPGAFPVHTPDKILIKDIEHWQDYLHAPQASGFPDDLVGHFPVFPFGLHRMEVQSASLGINVRIAGISLLGSLVVSLNPAERGSLVLGEPKDGILGICHHSSLRFFQMIS